MPASERVAIAGVGSGRGAREEGGDWLLVVVESGCAVVRPRSPK